MARKPITVVNNQNKNEPARRGIIVNVGVDQLFSMPLEIAEIASKYPRKTR